MIIIQVSGGVVSEVSGCNDEYEILDWDELLPSEGNIGDTERYWNELFQSTRDYVKSAYPDDYARVMARIERIG